MSTALSWTESGRPTWSKRLLDPVRDLGALLKFRSSGLNESGRRKLRIAGAGVVAITLAAIIAPAYSRSLDGGIWAGRLVGVLPSIYLGFLVLAVVTAAASGGGREVVPRDQAVAWPISPTTDHLGALTLAPLNVAWLLEAWTLLGMTSYVAGPRLLPLTVIPVLLFLVLATALGQVVAWTLEWVRRGPHGRLLVRSLNVVVVASVVALVMTHHLGAVLDHSPTVRVFLIALNGSGPTLHTYVLPLLALLLLTAAAVVAGAVPAGWAARRAPKDEYRLESGSYQPRSNPASDLRAMVRVDQASVWRSVPLRRGLVVLALMPGAIAFAGQLQWDKVTILPGLVASGAALLFGVNGWSLDGRGGLWRESLPYDAGLSFASRLVVLTEVLLGTAAITLVMAAVRAGTPSASELVAVLSCLAVVAAQVVSASMRWSVNRPFAVDMRSARATPAPPVVMVGYSARLALGTTFVGLLFSAAATWTTITPSLVMAVFFLSISTIRISRTLAAWKQPEVRAKVVVTVAG